MQIGKRYSKRPDEVMAYRITAVTPQPNGSYSLVLESLTGLQPYDLAPGEVSAAAPPEVGDYLVFPDHLRSSSHSVVARAIFERSYQEIPEPAKGAQQ